ncbi:MAG: transcription antitermination factor NusB [Chloroflexota bacterium]
MKARRKARSLALQVLYEVDCAHHAVEVVFRDRLADMPVKPDVEVFARQLADGVLHYAADLDALIQKHAPEWPLDQMATIDKTILRMAIWEFSVSRATPLKVAINEAVELAKLFGSESAARFVNGVLGSLAAKENELIREMAAKVLS